MNKDEIIKYLKNKEDISKKLNTENIKFLFELIESNDELKYQAEKSIRNVSNLNPVILYPYFERIAIELNSKNNFIKFGFILSIPNLLKVDALNKWYLIREKYIDLLDSNNLIEYSNTVKIIHIILKYRKEEAKVMIPKLLKVNNHIFYNKSKKSSECKNIAIGIVIDELYMLYNDFNYKKEILKFVNKNLKNKRPQVVKKANKFIKKYGE